jgi:hypothetical protein
MLYVIQQCINNTLNTLELHIFRFLKQNPYMPTLLIHYKFISDLMCFFILVLPPVL